ncbi:GrpE protein 1 [Mactra antiquata]
MVASMRTLRTLTSISRSLLFSSRANRLTLFENSTSRASYSVAANSSDQKEKSEEANTEQTKTEEVKDKKDAEGPSEIETKLTEERDKLKIDLKDMKDNYIRALAETENVRTRMRKQVDDAKIFGIQGFCKDLLEVADILDQATGSVPAEELDKNSHLKSLFDGLNMTNTQLLKVFGRHGLEKISPDVGDKFDPFYHEALFQVPKQESNEEGTIAATQKTGFKLHDRTIRPALVGVFK